MTALVVARHMRIPSPIMSRIYQQLSKGMLGFNQALKVAIVPFPFPFAQMITLLLVGFQVFCPMMTVIFTASSALCPLLTFLAVTGYWGLNEICVELEEPFGEDANDLPIVQLQRCFVSMLVDQCRVDVDRISESMVWAGAQAEPPEHPQDEQAILELNNELARRGIPHRFEAHLSLRDLQAYASLDVLERKFQSFDVAMVILPIVQRFLLSRATKETLDRATKDAPLQLDRVWSLPSPDQSSPSPDSEGTPVFARASKEELFARASKEEGVWQGRPGAMDLPFPNAPDDVEQFEGV